MTATLTPPPVTGTITISDTSSKTDKAMHWKVVLHNCDCHSFEQVEDALVKIIKCTLDKAKEHALEVHKNGLSIVFSGHKERCEAKYFHLNDLGLTVELTQ